MAAVELAVILPPLVLIFVGIVDYARAFSAAITVANCARNGALYACDSTYAAASGYASLTQAATADASNLSTTPTVSSSTGTDGTGSNYVNVTVSYTFQTIASYPGIPGSLVISRTVRMPISPP
jgi:Flp pilus assembly protein TadG